MTPPAAAPVPAAGLPRVSRPPRPRPADPMRLYVEPMDAVLVEFDERGRVRFEDEEWTTPSLQETRAILYAAGGEVEALRELVETLEAAVAPELRRSAPE